MVIVDTSVWIEIFRKPSRRDLDKLVDFDDVVTCLPIVQEVLLDCLIAACAIRNGLSVLHHDRDFDRLARISPLDSRAV